MWNAEESHHQAESTEWRKKGEITECFAYYFDGLLNLPGTVDDSALEKVNRRPVISCQNGERFIDEFVGATNANEERKCCMKG